jgi:hypothetical protein
MSVVDWLLGTSLVVETTLDVVLVLDSGSIVGLEFDWEFKESVLD